MMISPTPIELTGTLLFVLALIHTFSTKIFEKLAHNSQKHAGLWHLLGEVEVVFGFWALVLMLFMFATVGRDEATHYLDSRNFTEPLFVFAIMVIAASRPILKAAAILVQVLARLIPLPKTISSYFLLLGLVPLMGSFITEPAAMTLAALMLKEQVFKKGVSQKLMYATIGTLFVNISIGGVLTPFAAPPVLMVASKWGWDTSFMMANFGWKAVIAVTINAVLITMMMRKELLGLPDSKTSTDHQPMPLTMMLVHGLFLLGVVVFSHHAAVFLGIFLFFLGFTAAYERYQDQLILKEALLVGFFLGGLIVLGGQQEWWLKPLLMRMSDNMVYFGATGLTALTDNAALTYLGSLVDGLADSFKYALVAGAVTGGGLTVIANAPNPAGVAILRSEFEDHTVHPLNLLISALLPTAVAIVAFKVL